RRAASAVTAIGDQAAAERPGLEVTGDERPVAPRDRVEPELVLEVSFRGEGPREHEQPARLLVEAMDDAERAAAPALAPRELPLDERVERVALGVVVRHRAHVRRLLDDDHVRIDVNELLRREPGRARARRGRDELEALPRAHGAR